MILLQIFWSFIASKPGATLEKRERERERETKKKQKQTDEVSSNFLNKTVAVKIEPRIC